LAKGVKWACVDLILSMCSRGGVHPLRGGAFPYGAANLLRGGAPTLSHLLHLALFGAVGEVAAHTSPLGFPLLTLGAPSSIGNFTLWLYIRVLLPLQASWSLGRIVCCIIDIVILFAYRNKIRLWRSNWWIVQVCGCICV
jgi:hypothetical protein